MVNVVVSAANSPAMLRTAPRSVAMRLKPEMSIVDEILVILATGVVPPCRRRRGCGLHGKRCTSSRLLDGMHIAEAKMLSEIKRLRSHSDESSNRRWGILDEVTAIGRALHRINGLADRPPAPYFPPCLHY